MRACQNFITPCPVVGDSRSKFENALSRAVLEDFTCGRESMTARTVGHPQPAAALHRMRIGPTTTYEAIDHVAAMHGP